MSEIMEKEELSAAQPQEVQQSISRLMISDVYDKCIQQKSGCVSSSYTRGHIYLRCA